MGALHMSKLEEALEEMGRVIAEALQAHKNSTENCRTAAESLSHTAPKAVGSRNFTQCDSLLIGKDCAAHTVPYIEARNGQSVFEHEATTTRLSDDQLFYCQQRGLDTESAVALLVNGFVRDVLQHLPMEFMVETQKLIAISLEGSVG